MSVIWTVGSEKTCPFCNGGEHAIWIRGDEKFHVECMMRDCGATGPARDTEEEAITAWDERAEVEEP